MTGVVMTAGAIRRAKLQSNCHHQQTNTQMFTGRMPFLSLNQQCQGTDGQYGPQVFSRIFNVPNTIFFERITHLTKL